MQEGCKKISRQKFELIKNKCDEKTIYEIIPAGKISSKLMRLWAVKHDSDFTLFPKIQKYQKKRFSDRL